MKAYRVLIAGRVQGVNFRQSLRQVAIANGVYGWVRNLESGEVEAFIQGKEQSLNRVLEFCHKGPPGARVDSVRLFARNVEDFVTFEIRL